MEKFSQWKKKMWFAKKERKLLQSDKDAQLLIESW